MIKAEKVKNLKLNDLIPERDHAKISQVLIETNYILNCTEITVIYQNDTFKELEELEGIHLEHIDVIKEIKKKFKTVEKNSY